MKKTLLNCLPLFVSSLLLLTLPAKAIIQAHVDSGEVGQGFLVKRLDTCYLITPAHVLGGDLFAAIKTNTQYRSLGEAEAIETFGYDISLMSISGIADRECTTEFASFMAIDNLLHQASNFSVRSVNADGSQSLVPVQLTDSGIQYLRVKPTTESTPLYKGLSGSLVYNKDTPLGMLQSIDAETGEGIVLRIDRLIDTIKPFFASNASDPMQRAARSKNSSLLLTPLKWSEKAVNQAHRLNKLFDNNMQSSWSVNFHQQPIAIEIQLGYGETSEYFDQVLLTQEKMQRQHLPKDFEIFSTRKAEGNKGWVSIHSGTWIKSQKEKVIHVAPVKAKRVKIIFYSNWGGGQLQFNELTLR